MIFWDRKSQNQFFSIFFTTKSPNFISNLNDDCSQLSFEVYNICVAQKLRILEFLTEFFSPGPCILWRPSEAAISTSATSIGYQILAKDLSFHMRLCLLLYNEIERSYTTIFHNGLNQPPMYLTDQKAHVF